MKKKNKYTLQDGGSIAAASANEFVTLLREGSRLSDPGDNRSFMIEFAQRYRSLYDKEVDTSSEEAFLADLLRTGYAIVAD